MQQSCAASAHTAMPTLGTTPKAPTSSRGSAEPIHTAWQSLSHRSVAGGGGTPQIPHPHLLGLGRLELLQMPAHSRISAAHRPTCAKRQHGRCCSETTHTQRNTTRPRDAPRHGSTSAHSLPPRVMGHKPPCDACGACAVSVCRFGGDVQMCDREHAPVSPFSPLSPFGPVGPVAPDRCTTLLWA